MYVSRKPNQTLITCSNKTLESILHYLLNDPHSRIVRNKSSIKLYLKAKDT